MSWKIQCPHCGEPYNISEEHFGKRYRCMMCKEPFTMPTAEELRRANMIRCPVCLAEVAPTADICPRCGGKMPIKVGCLKNLFCVSVMICGVFCILMGMMLMFFPAYSKYDRRDNTPPIMLGMIIVGIGSVFFFGGGAVRRRR